jgi:hypothetical protein
MSVWLKILQNRIEPGWGKRKKYFIFAESIQYILVAEHFLLSKYHPSQLCIEHHHCFPFKPAITNK